MSRIIFRVSEICENSLKAICCTSKDTNCFILETCMNFLFKFETFLTGSLKRHKIIDEHTHLSKHENELFLEFIFKQNRF